MSSMTRTRHRLRWQMSLVSSDAGSYFDNQMVSIYKQEKTPEEAFQAVEDWYAENGYRK